MAAILVRAFRTGRLKSFMQRPVPSKVHFLDVCKADVPLPALLFLGRSDKTVTTCDIPSFDFFARCVSDFKNTLVRKVAALNFPQRVDPLKGLRKPFFKNHSDWQPNISALDPSVSEFIKHVEAD